MLVQFQSASHDETDRVLYYNATPKWEKAALEVQLTGLGGVKDGVLSVEILTDGGVVVPKRHEWRVDDTGNRSLPPEERTSCGFTFIGDELGKRSGGACEDLPSYPYYEGMLVKVRVIQATAGEQQFCIACTVKDGDGNRHQARSPPFFVSAARSGKRKTAKNRPVPVKAKRRRTKKPTVAQYDSSNSSNSSSEEVSSSDDSGNECHPWDQLRMPEETFGLPSPLSPPQVEMYPAEPMSPTPSLGSLTSDNLSAFDTMNGVPTVGKLMCDVVGAIKLLTENQDIMRTVMQKQTEILQKMNTN